MNDGKNLFDITLDVERKMEAGKKFGQIKSIRTGWACLFYFRRE